MKWIIYIKIRKKTQDPYAFGLWGHGDDLGDSQLENGKVKEGGALTPGLGSFQNEHASWQSQETFNWVLFQHGA